MEDRKINEELKAALKRTDDTIAEAIAYLKHRGIGSVPGQWLTLKRYCDKFSIADPQIVTDWIEKGVIPSENVHVLKDFEHITLIKAVPYQE